MEGNIMNISIKAVHEAITAAGYGADHLDDIVHDAASKAATEANNGGLKDQIVFLGSLGWSEKQILEAVNLSWETKLEPETQAFLSEVTIVSLQAHFHLGDNFCA